MMLLDYFGVFFWISGKRDKFSKIWSNFRVLCIGVGIPRSSVGPRQGMACPRSSVGLEGGLVKPQVQCYATT